MLTHTTFLHMSAYLRSCFLLIIQNTCESCSSTVHTLWGKHPIKACQSYGTLHGCWAVWWLFVPSGCPCVPLIAPTNNETPPFTPSVQHALKIPVCGFGRSARMFARIGLRVMTWTVFLVPASLLQLPVLCNGQPAVFAWTLNTERQVATLSPCTAPNELLQLLEQSKKVHTVCKECFLKLLRVVHRACSLWATGLRHTQLSVENNKKKWKRRRSQNMGPKRHTAWCKKKVGKNYKNRYWNRRVGSHCWTTGQSEPTPIQHKTHTHVVSTNSVNNHSEITEKMSTRRAQAQHVLFLKQFPVDFCTQLTTPNPVQWPWLQSLFMRKRSSVPYIPHQLPLGGHGPACRGRPVRVCAR